jgi:hypothetical protein
LPLKLWIVGGQLNAIDRFLNKEAISTCHPQPRDELFGQNEAQGITDFSDLDYYHGNSPALARPWQLVLLQVYSATIGLEKGRTQKIHLLRRKWPLKLRRVGGTPSGRHSRLA